MSICEVLMVVLPILSGYEGLLSQAVYLDEIENAITWIGWSSGVVVDQPNTVVSKLTNGSIFIGLVLDHEILHRRSSPV
jgi:hypothetical protein